MKSDDPLLSEAEFNRLVDLTRIGPSSRIMARRVLVDGISAARAGREQGKSRVLASRAVNTVKRAALIGHRCPHCGAMPDPKVVR